MLAGDLIMRALRNRGSSDMNPLEALDATFDPEEAPVDFDQGGTDPGNIAEFLAFDIAFEIEPTTGLIFPAGVDRG